MPKLDDLHLLQNQTGRPVTVNLDAHNSRIVPPGGKIAVLEEELKADEIVAHMQARPPRLTEVPMPQPTQPSLEPSPPPPKPKPSAIVLPSSEPEEPPPEETEPEPEVSIRSTKKKKRRGSSRS